MRHRILLTKEGKDKGVMLAWTSLNVCLVNEGKGF
jgi:hypothetical protein